MDRQFEFQRLRVGLELQRGLVEPIEQRQKDIDLFLGLGFVVPFFEHVLRNQMLAIIAQHVVQHLQVDAGLRVGRRTLRNDEYKSFNQ